MSFEPEIVPTNAPTNTSESAYDFFDNFSGADAPMNGRVPTISNGNAWVLTGPAFANDPTTCRAGAGKYYNTDTAGRQSYAIMKCSGTPWEISGVFESSDGVFTPTIAIVKDYPNHNFSAMWHANLSMVGGVNSALFTPSYWNDVWNGSASTVTAVAPQNASKVPTWTPAINTQYRFRLTINAPYCDYLISLIDGTPVATFRTYDPVMSSVIGPYVFFELFNTTTIWTEVGVRMKPTANSSTFGRFKDGLEASPLGMNYPASANFASFHVGFGNPVGNFSYRYDGTAADAPTFRSSSGTSLLTILGEAAGSNSQLNIVAGGLSAPGTFSITVTGGYVTQFSACGTAGIFMSVGLNSLIPTFASAIQIGGSGVGTSVRLFAAAAAPTSGAHLLGDIVKNSSPAVGSPKGWVCTVAGTPGTWVSEGNL